MTPIRSLLFNIYFPLWTLTLSIIASPFLLMPAKTACIVGHIWSAGTMLGLRVICGIKYEIRGRKNLPPAPFIIASKHQSAWETAIFLQLLSAPAYILKKELLKIPFFGLYLVAMKMIPIDRKGGTKALKTLLEDVKDRLNQSRPVIIFPEGTRTAPGEKRPYQPGIALIYKDVNVPVVPVALNSGYFWGKNAYTKKPGTIILEYLPPIPSGMDRKDFTATLEKTIEEGCERLIKTP